ncbi:GlxA family transcriptional regulator [Novilysobacter erysipheiresistens]|uniref:GlxA family transcriptional regulator n=1 Tax=Novilysobacter erysipheiresistens TaxID=1749332 RepID=A0ABU7YWV8_9GAMM
MNASPRVICMFAYADAQSLDIIGPMEVFALASRQAQEDDPRQPPLYEVRVVARSSQPITVASGIRILPDITCAELQETVDTLLVSGGMGDSLDRVREDTWLLAWLRQAATRVRRIGSVCSGALLLAEAGVLDGRQATTHWDDVAELKLRYPSVRVLPDAIYTRDAHVWTSAGITAGMDLALAMVAADYGQPLALKVAKRMVMVSKRSGGQSQFSRQLDELDLPDHFARLADWIRAHLRTRLDVDLLAQQVHMSPRQFNRRFKAAFGMTPQKYVEHLRVEEAKPLLESTGKSLQRIAIDCGFSSGESLRRAFVQQLGIRPIEYRQHFSAA